MEEQMMTNNISMAGYLLSNHFYDCLVCSAQCLYQLPVRSLFEVRGPGARDLAI